MRTEPLWVPVSEVIETNKQIVEATDEPFHVRDKGLLESACARPINYWGYGEDDMATLAVALLLGIAQNHPFEQGNKRTGFVSSGIFLQMNGFLIGDIDSEDLASLIIEVIEGKTNADNLCDKIRRSIQPEIKLGR